MIQKPARKNNNDDEHDLETDIQTLHKLHGL
jgi:hypothetical protein